MTKEMILEQPIRFNLPVLEKLKKAETCGYELSDDRCQLTNPTKISVKLDNLFIKSKSKTTGEEKTGLRVL